MESVLDSYLKQDEDAWKVWQQNQRIRAAMIRNREMLANYFFQRYDETLGWGEDEKMKTIVKGCFPLHPLTTAILSNHVFEAGAGENPRTALHFVRDRWERGCPNSLPNGTAVPISCLQLNWWISSASRFPKSGMKPTNLPCKTPASRSPKNTVPRSKPCCSSKPSAPG